MCISLSLSLYIYIYIYMYVFRYMSHATSQLINGVRHYPACMPTQQTQCRAAQSNVA